MKRLTLLLLSLITLTLAAQQIHETRRSESIFLYPEFRKATVLQPFGKKMETQGNILLKSSTFCFLDGDKVLEADISHIIGVQFDDTTKFIPTGKDLEMGRIVAQRGQHTLLRVTTIDADLHWIEESRNFNWSDAQKRESDDGYPLKDKFYYIVAGNIIPANETQFKKYVPKSKQKDFRAQMANRWWSWHDEECLVILLEYLED